MVLYYHGILTKKLAVVLAKTLADLLAFSLGKMLGR
jgi:hypothetical protein